MPKYIVITEESSLVGILNAEKLPGNYHEVTVVMSTHDYDDDNILREQTKKNLLKELRQECDENGFDLHTYKDWESLSNSDIFEVEEYCARINGTPYEALNLGEDE